MSNSSTHRIYASLLILGAGVLLFREITLLTEGVFEIFVWWAFALLILEMAVVIAGVAVFAVWFFDGSEVNGNRAFRLATAVVLVHALRVLIFAVGRTGPWVDFDVVPAQRAMHSGRWSWADVYFASAMSVISLIVLAYVWRLRNKTRGR